MVKKTKRSNISKSIPQKIQESADSKMVDIKKCFKTFSSKFKKFWKSLLDRNKERVKIVKKFIVIVAGYGLIINYSLHFLLGIKFNLFTLFAWGIAYYFISDEFIEWFRRLIAKR